MHTIGSRELGKNYRQGIAGMRRDLLDVFVDNMPKRKSERKGYLLALYLIRNNFLPRAYCRSDEMWNIEEQVNVAISKLTAAKSESDIPNYDEDNENWKASHPKGEFSVY